MPYHIDRWNSPGSITDWLNAINNLTSHNANRIGSARSHINTSFGLQGQIDVTLDVFPPLAGAVKISTITPGPLPWDGVYFKGCPVDFKAVASQGWMFDQWDANDHTALGELSETLSSQAVDLQQDDLFRARFAPCPTDGVASIVNSGNVLSVETSGVPFIDSIAWYSNDVHVGQGLSFETPFDGFYQAVVLFDGCSVTTESIWQGANSINETSEVAVVLCSPNPTNDWAPDHIDLPGIDCIQWFGSGSVSSFDDEYRNERYRKLERLNSKMAQRHLFGAHWATCSIARSPSLTTEAPSL